MRTIDKLALRDDYWQRTALTICKDKELARDLVQDMYLKLADSKFYSDWYVINTIRNLFVDTIRAKKIETTDENYEEYQNRKDESYKFEPTDEEMALLDKFNKLSYTQQELIEESYHKSDRKIGTEFGINYGYVHKKRIEGIKEILGDDFNLYNNINLKYLKNNK